DAPAHTPDHRTMPINQRGKGGFFPAADILFQELTVTQANSFSGNRRVANRLENATQLTGGHEALRVGELYLQLPENGHSDWSFSIFMTPGVRHAPLTDEDVTDTYVNHKSAACFVGRPAQPAGPIGDHKGGSLNFLSTCQTALADAVI